MTAATRPRNTWFQEQRDTLRLSMEEAVTIYQGTMVNSNAAGYAVPAADTAGQIFEGVAVEDPEVAGRSTYDNSAGADGAMHVVVRRVGRFRFACEETPVQAMLGAVAYVADDQTVAINDWNVTNDIVCGRVSRIPGDTLALDQMADFATDEIEIEICTYCAEGRDYNSALTTTTTTAGA